jgi:hypothetical protein
MTEVSFKIDTSAVDRLMKKYVLAVEDKPKLLAGAALYWQRLIDRTFDTEGGRDGLQKWAPRAESTIKTPAGTRRLAYGTDRVPRLTRQGYADARAEAMSIGWWKFGQKGYFRGYEGLRRYSSDRPVLYVSGGLKKMFSQIRRPGDRIIVGAPYLIKVGRRYVATSELISKTDHRPARPVFTIRKQELEAMLAEISKTIEAAVKKR